MTSSPAAAEPARPTIVSFVSPGPHSGRTSLVSNLAWMIASAGHDVLVLDWDSQGSSVHEFLAPFLTSETACDRTFDAELSRALSQAMSAGAGSPTLRRHLGTGADAAARLDVVRSPAAPGGPEPDDEVFVELRRLLVGAGYDYVLVDGPATGRHTTASRNGLLADAVVVCFRPDQDEYESAASLAVDVAKLSPVRARIISAPGFFDVSDPGRAKDKDAEIRSALMRVFRAGGPRRNPGELVQVPVPLYSLPKGLVALAYQAPDQQPLLTAYERLLVAVTGGVVRRLPSVPALVRDLYLRALKAEAPANPATVTADVLYHPADRPWADWAQDQLGAIGVRAVLRRFDDTLPETPGPRLVVLSQHSCGAVAGGETLNGNTVALKIDKFFDTEPPQGVQVVDIAGCQPVDSRSRLRAALACAGDSAGRAGSDIPFPGRTPRQWEVSPLDPGAIDRATELEALRDHLPRRKPARVLLHGGAASGKTELAKAFAHRFGYAYDTAWYVPAGTRQAARASLRRLGDKLQVDATGDKARATLRMLQEDARPYLLVYDDVQSLEAIADLLPANGSGHVIVVLLGAAPAEPAGTVIEVGPLSPAEAEQALLGQLAEEFRFAGLPSVVEAVGTDPLTLRLTAGYLGIAASGLESGARPISEDATAAVEEFVAAISVTEPSRQRLDEVGRTLFDFLEQTAEGRLLVAFARMCALLSPDGVSLRLVRSASFIDQLVQLAGESGTSLGLDSAEIEYTLASGVRAALFAVDWGRDDRLRMHRGIQRMIRELTGEEESTAARSRTQLALAGYAPSDAEYLAGYGRDELGELARHLQTSGAAEEKSSVAIRRWVVLQTAFAARSSDRDVWAEAAAAAEKVLGLWSPLGDDRLTTRLGTHYADLLRLLGKNTESLNVDLQHLGTLRPMLGPAHLRTSISLRGTAGDLRGLGLFAEARIEDVSVYRSFKSRLGADHPQTLNALHNLALSNFLDGRQEDAAGRENEGFRLRLRLLGEDDYTTWWAGLDLGIYLREIGRLTDARAQLETVVNRLKELRGEEDPLTLRATVALGVTIRRIAVAENSSASVSKARTLISQAVIGYEQVLGTRALATQAARMSLSTDLAYHRSDLPDAIDVAHEALDVFEQVLRASHPFAGLCHVNLAALYRQSGQLEKAAEQAGRAIEILDESFLNPHPWKLAARINLANVLLCRGDGGQAQELITAALETAESILPTGHPYLMLLRNSITNIDAWRASAARGEQLVGLIDVDVEIPAT
jgi:tetratricopeptide (TPR) repeat protein